MRNKKDLLIQYKSLANTAMLTDEELGMLIRYILVLEDTEDKAVEDATPMMKKKWPSIKKLWTERLEKYAEGKEHILQSLEHLNGQISRSRKAFEDMKNRIEGKEKQQQVFNYKWQDGPDEIMPELTEYGIEKLTEKGIDIGDMYDFINENHIEETVELETLIKMWNIHNREY